MDADLSSLQICALCQELRMTADMRNGECVYCLSTLAVLEPTAEGTMRELRKRERGR